jgi:hypothetical protein
VSLRSLGRLRRLRGAARRLRAVRVAVTRFAAGRRLRRRVAFPGLLGVTHAGLERSHEIDDLLLGGGSWGGDNLLLARGLAVDELEDLVAVGVLVALRLERLGERLDELLGHAQLALAHVDAVHVLDTVELCRVVDLVGVHHGRHDQHPVLGSQRRQVLLGAHHEAGDRHLALLLHGALQEGVGLAGALVRRHVVRGVVEHGVDLREVDELLDVDRAGRLGVEGGQLVVANQDVLARRQLVALGDRLVGHLVTVGGRHLPVLDPRAGASVDLVEGHVLARHGGEQLDGDVDQPEADGTAPHGTGHAWKYAVAVSRCVPVRHIESLKGL